MNWITNPENIYKLIVFIGIATLVGVAAQTVTILYGRPLLWIALLVQISFAAVLVAVAYPAWPNTSWYHGWLFVSWMLIMSMFVIGRYVNSAFTLFFVLSGVASLHLPLRQALFWNVAFMLSIITASILVHGIGGVVVWISAIGGFLFFGMYGVILRQSNAAHEQTQQLFRDLESAHAQLQTFAHQSEQLAIAEERNRLARELHDSLGHRLTVAILQLEGAHCLVPIKPAQAQTMIENMRQELKAAMGELRHTLGSLRSAETTAPQSLHTLVKTFEQATNLDVSLSLPEPMPTLPETHRIALYRAAQEGLTNIQRHAAATHAWVTVTLSPTTLKLLVEDNGIGLTSPVKDGSFGLIGLQERATDLTGNSWIEKRPKGGTQLHFQLPL